MTSSLRNSNADLTYAVKLHFYDVIVTSLQLHYQVLFLHLSEVTDVVEHVIIDKTDMAGHVASLKYNFCCTFRSRGWQNRAETRLRLDRRSKCC